jgi:hypothetical protein
MPKAEKVRVLAVREALIAEIESRGSQNGYRPAPVGLEDEEAT